MEEKKRDFENEKSEPSYTYRAPYQESQEEAFVNVNCGEDVEFPIKNVKKENLNQIGKVLTESKTLLLASIDLLYKLKQLSLH